MRERWDGFERELARLLKAHQRAGVPLAIVFVPSEFQVQRHLCESARKRLGWEAQQVDLDLPRRRLTALAARHDISLYDLSPGLEEGDASPFHRHSSQWNAEGIDRVATSLGRWLHARYGAKIASISRPKTH